MLVRKKENIWTRRKKTSFFCFLFCFCFSIVGFSQSTDLSTSTNQASGLTVDHISILNDSNNSAAPLPSLKSMLLGNPADLNLDRKAPLCIGGTSLPFFCKIEVEMEKASKMMVRFRLGDVDVVDRMEGKRD